MASGWSRARCPASRWGQFCLSSTGRPAAPKGRSLRLCSQCARAAGAGGIQEQSDRQGQGRRCRGCERQGPWAPVGQACEGGRQGRGRAGAAAQRSRPTMARAGRSGPARQRPASGAALNGLASGGAAAERARDCRCRRPRLFVLSRRPRARPRRAIAATNVATSRRGGCPGARIARARRTAIAMIMT